MRRLHDCRSLAFVGITFSFLIYSLNYHFSPWPVSFLYIIGGSLLVFVTSVINHNHRHLSIFESDFLNRVLNVFISLCLGAPSSRLHQVHLYNHHRHFRNDKDWTFYKTKAQGSGYRRIGSYLWNGVLTIFKRRRELRNIEPDLDFQIQIERVLVFIFFCAAFSNNPWVVGLIWLPSWALGLSFLFTSNLLNHDRCKMDSALEHSRDFTNRFENWIFFNNGFHTSHHLQPQAHWGDLPQIHAEKVKPFKDRRFVSNSYFWFLGSYFWGTPESQNETDLQASKV